MDDPRAPIEGHEHFGFPLLKVGMVVALTLAVLGIGYFGPHPAKPSPSVPSPAPPSGVPSASAASLPTAVLPAPSTPVVGAAQIGIQSLKRVDPAPGQMSVAWLPDQISSPSLALLGRRLYYVVDGNRIAFTGIGAAPSGGSVITASTCEGINQLAAAGHELAYVVTSPGGPSDQMASCGDPSSVSWSIWLLDLNGGLPHQVAHGTREATALDIAEFPVHLALTESAYAFDRPPASAAAGIGETVEVHALDGRLLESSHTQRPVAAVMLGGSTLAVLEEELSHSDKVFALWASGPGRPDLAPVDEPSRSAALSSDGSYLTWDVVYRGPYPTPADEADVAIETVVSGREVPLAAPTDRTSPAPLRPAIWSVNGRLAITWFATAPGGAVYPAIRYATGGYGAFVASVQQPLWMEVQGSTLVWVVEDPASLSKAAFAVDISSLGLG
jgi:hypothetical protein